LQGLLKYDPANRLTAPEALRHPFFTEEFWVKIFLAASCWLSNA
jgi:serine/threonine protein kinase